MLYAIIFLVFFPVFFANGAQITSLCDLIVDQTIYLPKEKIDLYSPNYCSTPTSLQTIESILKKENISPLPHPGGSGTNTIIALSQLGHQCSLIGKLGTDPLASIYLEKMEEYGVQIHYATAQNSPTSRVLCLIDKENGHRAMLSFFGATLEMKAEEIQLAPFQSPQLVHLEAYSLYRKPVLDRMIALAKAAKAKISIDLSSYVLVEKFKNEIQDMLETSVDIVFANETEAERLTHLCDPQEAALALSKMCDIAVVHIGEKGGYVASKDHVFFFEGVKARQCIDATGAGDLFAAGFLHGYLTNLKLEDCAKLGALFGSAIVEIDGVHLPKETLFNLTRKIIPLEQRQLNES